MLSKNFEMYVHIFQNGEIETEVIMKVDGCGFFIYWKGDGTEGDVLELSQVNDIRSGKCPNVSNDKQYLLHHGKIS